jgi:hypothetical protein
MLLRCKKASTPDKLTFQVSWLATVNVVIVLIRIGLNLLLRVFKCICISSLVTFIVPFVTKCNTPYNIIVGIGAPGT